MEDFSKYIIHSTCTIKEALIALNNISGQTLTLFVVDNQNKMIGTLTDGDIRRKLIADGTLTDLIVTAMQENFHFLKNNNIDISELKLLKQKGIVLIPCLDSQKKIIKIYNLKKNLSILPIDAVLMAGGKGERLRPLTENTPKPLLKVGEKTIIDYNVDRLISYGIENISITVNYLKENIEQHFEKKRNNIQVKCVREPKYLGTIGSVKFIDTFQNDTVLIMNSDLFTNIDYEDFYLHFKQHNADMSVAAVPYSVSVPYGIFELEGRNIQGIKEKPTYNYYANAGIYLIKKELLKLIPNNTFFNATDFMELVISEKKNVVRFPIVGYWLDIGAHEDYKKAQELVKHL